MHIIDGYNLLRTVEKVSEHSESINDVRLCHVLGRYLRAIGRTGEIVFDGIGPPEKSVFDNIGGLDVFFSGRASDADTVIEDKIMASTAPRELIVVSSDRRLRDAARARRAKSVKAEVFWTDLQKQLSRKKSPREPSAKQLGLSEGETEEWLRLFGIEQ